MLSSFGLFSLRFIGAILSLLPFALLYRLSDVLSWALRRVIKYRYSVIHQNLHNSFPEKTKEELEELIRQYYRNFSDLILETIKGTRSSKNQLQPRFIYRNPEIFEKLYHNNKSAILLGGHFGNWEWAILTFPLAVKHKVAGIYKPLKNKGIDRHLNEIRGKWGNNLISMSQTGRAIIELKNEPCIFVFVADQTPSDVKNAHWLNFLNQDTPFHHGADKLARKTNYPVFYSEVIKTKRGHYEMTIKELCANPAQLKEGDITLLYAGHLEKSILENPATWLWSHRRWKRKRTKIEGQTPPHQKRLL